MTSSSTRPSLTLGAYALTPGADLRAGAAENEFYDGLTDLGIDTIELPLLPPGAPGSQPAWIAAHLRPEWQLMITCIPRTMHRLSTTPTYGLSSTDPDARAAALADLAEVRDLVHTLADDAGHPRVTAIEVHSAPGPRHGSLNAFAASLDELLTWDLGGARLIIEHCDALIPGQDPAKGFWPIEDEIACALNVLGTTNGANARIGVGINWGRSAIEGRSAATPVAHVAAAADAGLLRAMIFSGATDQATAWGPAWGDAHIAPSGTAPVLKASSASLLGETEMTATLAAAGGCDLDAVGIKVTQPPGTEVQARLSVARAGLDLVRSAQAAVHG